MRRAFWLGCIVTAMALVACGGDGDSASADTPEGAVQAYLDSLHEKDFAAACSVFTEETLDEPGLEGTGYSGVSCEEGLGDQYADDEVEAYEDVELKTVEEAPATAVVEMTESNTEGTDSVYTISLVKEGSEWKIDGSSYEPGSI